MTDRALVLNASYEPLGIVSSHRAVALLLNDKATMLEAGDEVFRSESLSLSSPSVVLLTRYVRVPRRRVQLTKRALLLRDDFTCAYCRRRGETLDHVVPRSRGGTHSWTNLVAACVRCNNKKADHLLEEIGWTLSFEPYEPHMSPIANVDRHPAWTSYLSVWHEPDALAS
jgi:5-methylcytosine-specific restriction endonuclease McrA